MSCGVGEAAESLENELFPSLHLRHSYFSNLPSLYLRHSSFSNPSVASPKSQLILQPFRRFTYVTAHSPTLLSVLLHLRIFTYITWRAAHDMDVSKFNKTRSQCSLSLKLGMLLLKSECSRWHQKLISLNQIRFNQAPAKFPLNNEFVKRVAFVRCKVAKLCSEQNIVMYMLPYNEACSGHTSQVVTNSTGDCIYYHSKLCCCGIRFAN